MSWASAPAYRLAHSVALQSCYQRLSRRTIAHWNRIQWREGVAVPEVPGLNAWPWHGGLCRVLDPGINDQEPASTSKVDVRFDIESEVYMASHCIDDCHCSTIRGATVPGNNGVVAGEVRTAPGSLSQHCSVDGRPGMASEIN